MAEQPSNYGMAGDPRAPDIDLVPSLRQAIEAAGLNPASTAVLLATDKQKHLRLPDRHRIEISDGQRFTTWTVPSLRELFRGDRSPPADIAQYPPGYTPYFFFIEDQLLTLCDAIGDRTDQELEEAYAALRRRPDGRSLGPTHDFLWQVVALLLGCYPLSEAEFDGIIGALLGSARKWGLRPVSRFCVGYLRQTFAAHHSATRMAR